MTAGRLIGREMDLERLRELLDDASVRWLTIVGLGGVGKSLLVAECLSARTGEDLFFCSLDGLGSEGFELAVASALGGEAGADVAAALRAAIARPTLLVIESATPMEGLVLLERDR